MYKVYKIQVIAYYKVANGRFTDSEKVQDITLAKLVMARNVEHAAEIMKANIGNFITRWETRTDRPFPQIYVVEVNTLNAEKITEIDFGAYQSSQEAAK